LELLEIITLGEEDLQLTKGVSRALVVVVLVVLVKTTIVMVILGL
jgi:hypothetical protein